MRDPTRGGVATALNELARDSRLAIVLEEDTLPVRDAVRGACELLGLDPLHIANEGQFLAVVAPELADAALAALQSVPGGEEAVLIGEVRSEPARTVLGPPPTAATGSSTCWWAIRCPGSADASIRRGAPPRAQPDLRNLFPRESERLALASQEMAERFLKGGRLLAFGRGHWATDAQHVAVEFVHPVIVGKRALPALDLSLSSHWLEAVLQPHDIVMAFGPDPEILHAARARGAQTFALPGTDGDYAVEAPSPDPYISQELIEILYHTLWETVHVFFEHRELGHQVGAAGFLYPFLGEQKQDTGSVIAEVAASIETKAREDERLREEVATSQGERIVKTALAIRERLRAGGKLILFGNGGSATDANDFALDCSVPLKDFLPSRRSPYRWSQRA